MKANTDQKFDCVVRVVTPENIEFEYRVAGPFQRLPAFLIDFALRVVIYNAGLFALAILGIPIGQIGGAFFMLYAFLGFFLLSWLYGAVMEARFNGRTVGKILLGLRVISSDGRPINGSQAAMRNLLRLCDFMPPLSLTLFFPDAPALGVFPTFFIGLVAMTLTVRMQRIGDLAAGTMVVWDRNRGVGALLQPEDVRAFALADLIPPSFLISRSLARTVGHYMERRGQLAPAQRERIASHLAQPLCEKFDLRADTSSDLLLCALYVHIYHSEEQRAAHMAVVKAVQRSQVAGPIDAVLMPQTSASNIYASPHNEPVYRQPDAVLHPEILDAQVLDAEVIEPSTSVAQSSKGNVP